MKKGKLIITANAQGLVLSRMYINPVNPGEKENPEDSDWRAYDGMCLYLRSGYGSIQVALFNEKGKDITSSISHMDDLNSSDAVALTEAEKQAEADSKKSFFGLGKKGDSATRIKEFDSPQNESQKVIARVVEKIQADKSRKEIKKEFFDLIIRDMCEGKTADVAIDQYFDNKSVAFVSEFEIEYDGKFNCEKLKFFFYNGNFHEKLLLAGLFGRTAIMDAIEYDGCMYFGKTRLTFTEDRVVDPNIELHLKL